MQSPAEIETLRLLHLSKRERAEENWNRKAEEEALADEELLKSQIAEAFAELEQARLSKLSKPVPVRSHDMETRGHALPRVCALHQCNNEVYVLNEVSSPCCKRSHLKYLYALRGITVCKLPGCAAIVQFDPRKLKAYDFALLNTLS